jgi:excinuclease ABC subunit C
MVLNGKKEGLITELQNVMRESARALHFEQAGKLRDQIQALMHLKLRGDVDKNVQPEVFVLDPKRGVRGLKKILKLDSLPRVIEGIDIAHFHGSETVASLVQFVDGVPFKPGYRRFRIQSVDGVDDFASIREVVTRRYRRLQTEEELMPDLIMIDGGKGQLHAAQAALRQLRIAHPSLISLAKREEEIYTTEQSEPLKLSRNSAALRLLQYIRDEAHRFAQHYHKLLRHKKLSDGYDERQGE